MRTHGSRPAYLPRDYSGVLAAVRDFRATGKHAEVDRERAMKVACDLLWDAFHAKGLSWIGFYGIGGVNNEPDQMTLLARRDKPACSPIGLHGCCGRGWKERKAIVVDDVRTLGPNYVACDPRDQAELVLPMLEADGRCWGVLDADSFDTHAFDDHDVRGMTALVEMLGLTAPIKGETLRL